MCKHELDVTSVKGVPDMPGDGDGSVVVEVACKKCGQMGSIRIRPEDVGFDLR
jgi:hypothetical protein